MGVRPVAAPVVAAPVVAPGSITEGARLDIDLAAVAANWRALRRRHRAGATGAAVKADGYGLGAVPIASRLYDEGCRHFFVALAEEAVALRPVAPAAMLCVLNGLPPGAEADIAAAELVPALASLEQVARWAAHGRQLGQALPALLHVDTGMARTGLSAAEIERVEDDPGLLAGIDWRYVMTHLVSAERPDDPVNAAQRAAFAALSWLLPGVPRSLANSAGIFLGPDFGSALARPGAALYGVNPTPGAPNPQTPVVRLTAPVLQVRDIPAGAGVGYNATWRAARPSRIATVGVGYADGFLRAQSNRGAAAFDGAVLPLVGRVSMDLTTFDVTDAPAVGPGSRLELIGPTRTLADVAAAAGTNEYEILTALGRRHRRVWSA
jgi:alanine racemase